MKGLSFKERVVAGSSQLSKAQRQVADFILHNSRVTAVSSGAEIGKQAGVSETTVIRLCHTLGYSGYSQLQKELQAELVQDRSSLGTFVESKQTLADRPLFFENNMEKHQNLIAQMSRNLDEKTLDKIVQQLVDAENILIVGVQASFPAAMWFRYTLNLLRKNVSLYREDGEPLFFLTNELTEEDVVFVITFHRYGASSLRVAKEAKKRGAKVIAITDSVLSPIAPDVDTLIPLGLGQHSTIDMSVPLLSLLHSITAAYSVKDTDRVKKRLDAFEKWDGGMGSLSQIKN